MGLLAFLAVYFLGGFTFLPLLALTGYAYFYHTAPIARKQEGFISSADIASGIVKTNDEKTLNKLKTEQDVAAGYFAVTREWTPGGINGKPPERITPVGTTSIKGEEPSQSMYQTVVGSIFNRKGNVPKGDVNGQPKKKRAANVFYVVLRHGHLMLYDDQEQLEVRHVISLSHHSVSIYGGGEKIPEGELYIRRNAICLTRKDAETAFKLDNASLSKPFYLFSENCSEKEDFYFALLKTQERAPEENSTVEPPSPLGFDPAHLILLVQNLHSSEEQYQTRWINAILGRLFLAFYKTPDLERFFKNKIDKKIARVKKPAFLSDVVIQKVDVGEGAPFITNPRLKELKVDGETIVEANVSYSGGFRIEIFTAARIDLGARFKTREVDLMLAAVLKKLEGRVLIRIKPPPSNRIWVAFESMPKMELNIEPIISQRSITYGPILRLIENRVREVIEETLVYPHFDDLPFTDTINQAVRGGIWKLPKHGAPEPSVSQPVLASDRVDNETESPVDDSITESPDAKSMSMPNLQSLSPDGKKNASSSVSVTDISSDTSSGLTHRAHRKPKSMRTSSFNQLTSPQPLVSTEAVNVTAIRDTSHTDSDKGAAKSQVKATIDRSRSVSMPGSPRGTPVGSPSNSIPPLPSARTSTVSIGEEGESQDEFHPAPEEPTNGPPAVPARHSRSQSLSTAASASSTPIPSTPPNIYGGGSRALTNSTISPISSRTSSNLSTALNQQNPSPGAKPAINNAINKGVAAVTKWYKGKTEGNTNSNAPTSPTSIEGFLRNGTQSHNSSSSHFQPAPAIHVHHSSPNYPLPPAEIPPPPAKRTAPIAVPKRKPLPPPLLPARANNNRRVIDDVMVVAAPPAEPDEDSSEPSTPPDEFMVSLDGNTVHHHQNSGNGLAGLGMMLRGDRDRPSVPRRPSSNSASGSSGGSIGGWDTAKHQRQRGGSRSGETVGIGNISLKGKTSPGRTRGSSGSGFGGHLGIGMVDDGIPWNEVEEAELRNKAGW